jgi:hypothetical protein
MRFEPTSGFQVTQEPQGDSRGRKALIQQGELVGRFRIRAEQGFTEAKASRIDALTIHSFRETCKGANAVDEPAFVPETKLLAWTRVKGKAVGFRASARDARGGRIEEFDGVVAEARGRLGIERRVYSSGGDIPGQFTFDQDAQSAVAAPPAPFLGSAELGAKGSPTRTWTGDLSASFLGVGKVSLAGLRFQGQLGGFGESRHARSQSGRIVSTSFAIPRGRFGFTPSWLAESPRRERAAINGSLPRPNRLGAQVPR